MKRQHGAAMPEMAIIALVFFMVLFGVIEVGRLMFMWNTLTEATRRGARIAAVCPFFDNYIKVAAVFGDSAQPDAAQNSPILPGLDTGDVSIAYYRVSEVDAATGEFNCAGFQGPAELRGDELDGTSREDESCIDADAAIDSDTEAPFIRFVQVGITYQSRFIAPVIGDIFGNYVAPRFKTLLPVESLGALQASPNHCP
ncbi:MAG: TadE/TadG family type IV pilus assembly protein [Gammaproteobacteria bacterium]